MNDTEKVIEILTGTVENEGSLPPVINYEVLEKAICRYGFGMQTDMAIEEMSELTKALLKERRYFQCCSEHDIPTEQTLSDNIAEEMADVIVMLVQLQMIYDNKDKVLSYINSKVKRLKTRIEKKDGE